LPDPAADRLFQIEPLGRQNKKGFSCGVEPLDRYLHRQAGQDARKRVATPFVMVERGGADVIGYYTLSALSVDLSNLPTETIRELNLPRYPQAPVTLLGRLALDQRYRGTGLGSMLLVHALARSLQVSQQVASVAVVADAKDDIAEAFYQHLGFIRFQDTARRLFLPMQTISRLFTS